MADQSDTTLNETVYKSFSAEESLVVAEKPASEKDPPAKTDKDLAAKDKSTKIAFEVEELEVEEILNKSFVEVVPSKPEVELIEMEKKTTRKDSLGLAEDLSLVIDDDEEDDDVVVKRATSKDKELKDATNKDKEVKDVTNKDKEVKEVTKKTEDFDLLILTDEPEQIIDLKENERQKDVEKQVGLSLEKKGSKCRGVENRSENMKLEMEARVNVTRIRTRSASVKEDTQSKVNCKCAMCIGKKAYKCWFIYIRVSQKL